MKKAMMMMAAIAFVFAGCKNGNEKPNDSVLAKFKEMFPNAQEVVWAVDEDGNFEADFTDNGKSTSAVFKADGTWIETEKALTEAEMPERAKNYLKLFHNDRKFSYWHETLSEKDLIEATFEKDSTEIEVYFDTAGYTLIDDVNPCFAAFRKKITNGMNAEWSKISDSTYQVRYIENEKISESVFASDGTWLITSTKETLEQLTNLNGKVTEALKKMKGIEFIEANHTFTPTSETFEVRIKNRGKDDLLIFDKDGSLIGSEVKITPPSTPLKPLGSNSISSENLLKVTCNHPQVVDK